MKFSGTKGEVNLITLDPGHFHAALVQKNMYEQVGVTVHVFAPDGPDVTDHLEKIKGFNQRPQNPTCWQTQLYVGDDYLEQMLRQKPGNVVVLAGNNRKKAQYIKQCIDAGLNVLADKPMCIDKDGFKLLSQAFDAAAANDVLLYDIMTERFEITTILQKELANLPEVFGTLQAGSPEEPAVLKESVHHLCKVVAGSFLKRPPWYFDTTQQGEGIVDVSTHLVDMAMWECFPEQIIDYQKDVKLIQSKRWPTMVTRQQFEQVTKLAEFPDYLQTHLDSQGILPCYCNGEMTYTLRGIHVRVKVTWDYQAPPGGGDTHYSIIRGSQANVIIRQGKEQNYRPELYLETAPQVQSTAVEKALKAAFPALQKKYPGIQLASSGDSWQILIPDSYRVGHEAHFGQVTQHYLKCLVKGKLPDWEVPNMIAKYKTTTDALEMARQ